jgi:hypothetical protein
VIRLGDGPRLRSFPRAGRTGLFEGLAGRPGEAFRTALPPGSPACPIDECKKEERMPIEFFAALVISLTLNSSALANASDQGCASSGNNASGCFVDILAAPGPLAEAGILVIAVGLAVLLRTRGGRKK